MLRAAALLVALGGLLSVLCLDTVDNTPYLRTPYYQATMARLQRQAATNVPVQGELAAGFGRALLTPTVNAPTDDPGNGRFRALPLAGYGSRQGRPATGVHDDVYVKAVALRVAGRLGVMVGADALIVPREISEAAVGRLERDQGLRREQIYLSATHTHCSLGGWGEGKVAEAFAGPFQPGVRVWFADRITAAVREAIADLKPASFGHGSFAAPEFVRNRLVGKLGTTDPEFVYAVLKQEGGRLGVLGSYAAHATVLSGRVMEFSADYPGAWQRAVEQATGGMAVFLAGGIGSHSPVPGEGGFPGAERMGQALANALLGRLAETPLTNRVAFDLLGLDVDLPSLQARVSDGVRLRPWLAARLLPVSPRTFLQALRIEDLIWVSTPCDFSGELALGIKEHLRTRDCFAAITSFNGDYIGYVIPARYYHLSGYEPRLMSFFGPTVPDYFDGLIRELAADVAGK